jgi:hypothetical protein
MYRSLGLERPTKLNFSVRIRWSPILGLLVGGLLASCTAIQGAASPPEVVRVVVVQDLAAHGVLHDNVKIEWTEAPGERVVRWLAPKPEEVGAMGFLCRTRCYVVEAILSIHNTHGTYKSLVTSFPVPYDSAHQMVTTDNLHRKVDSLFSLGMVSQSRLSLSRKTRSGRMPDLVLLTFFQAKQILSKDHVKFKTKYRRLTTVPFFTVLEQQPAAGQLVPAEGTVLTISS